MDEIFEAELFGFSDFDNEEMGKGRFTLNGIFDREAKDSFRFKKAHIPRVAAALGVPENITTEENITLTSVDALCIFLLRLAYPNRLVDLETVSGNCYKALSSISNKFMTIISENKSLLLENLGNVPWLTEDKLREYSEAIAEKGAPMNNCWGFIDDTMRPICRPSVNQMEYYSDYNVDMMQEC